MSGDHNHHEEHKNYDTFFEGTTVAIGFVYTILALGIIVALFALG